MILKDGISWWGRQISYAGEADQYVLDNTNSKTESYG